MFDARPDDLADAAQVVDVVVIGCGAAGLAAAHELARRGRSVIGLDRFEHGHTRGSSHGTERIVRTAYADPVHVRLALDSIEGWRRLEHDSGTTLLTNTGGIDTGSPAELDMLAREGAAAGVTMERLTAAEARVRFASDVGRPWFRFDGDVLHHPIASTVNAEQALIELRRLASMSGADIRADDATDRIELLEHDGVIVHHRSGRTRATVCLVTVGAWGASPWIAEALGEAIALPPLRVTQEQVGFFAFRDPPRHDLPFPTFVFREEPAAYGLCTPDGLLKVGEHHTGREIDPDRPAGSLEPESWARLLDWVERRLPAVDPTPLDSTTCLYAGYPDDMFVMDRSGPVVIGLGFSGHGFKFVPEIGRRLADLADGITWPENPFAFERPILDVGASGRR